MSRKDGVRVEVDVIVVVVDRFFFYKIFISNQMAACVVCACLVGSERCMTDRTRTVRIRTVRIRTVRTRTVRTSLVYTSVSSDDQLGVDLGGRRLSDNKNI